MWRIQWASFGVVWFDCHKNAIEIVMIAARTNSTRKAASIVMFNDLLSIVERSWVALEHILFEYFVECLG